ncbi:Glutathione transport system permease protein GsiD [Geodia barretti]|uniref:Glutathione transport system permease protein GsiD n=1 Tax=Geodia barretti TaxID=519541 RepID=A0AA35R5U9_GEOBA|nr:Glutathione transport system permease protein GsiD [Geodia barretti]
MTTQTPNDALSARNAAALDAGTLVNMRPRPTWYGNIMRFCRSKPLGGISAAIIILTLVAAVLAPVIVPHDPLDLVHDPFVSPSSIAWLGSDDLGRDVFSRIIAGARISMYVGVMSVLIGITIGTAVGILSAYVGGVLDLIIQRVVDALMAFPAIIMALGLMAALGASVLSIKELDYTLAAQAIGARPWRIMIKHILPNVTASYIVLSTITLGLAIVIEASLSFLGVGVPPDVPTWGGMLTEGASQYIRNAPWLAVFPGLAISVIVFSINFLGDALRDTLDPRLRGR